jgi:superfamily II DNA or RNA helicase
MSKYRYTIKDPDKAYISNNVLLPKSRVNVQVIKAALRFVLNEEVEVLDPDTQELTGYQSRVLNLWDETDNHIIIPREFLQTDQYSEFPCEFVQVPRPVFEEVDFTDNIILRDEEQIRAFNDLLYNDSGVLNLSCGKGKTILALKAVAVLGVPAIVVVNSTALLEQWKEEIATHLGIHDIGVVQGTVGDWRNHKIVVAMIHTLSNKSKSWPSEFRKRFGLVIYDECFPAGTLVGNIQIQKIKPGEYVPSYEPSSGQLVYKRVVRIFKTRVSSLLRLHIGGKTIICTSNHPFLTKYGWTAAQDLTGGSMVRSVIELPGKTFDYAYPTYSNSHMQRVWIPYAKVWKSEPRTSKKKRGLLLQAMRGEKTLKGEFRENGSNQSKIRLGENDKEQPNEKARGESQAQNYSASYGLEAHCTGREWKTSSGSSTALSVRLGVADGSINRDPKCKGKKLRQGIQIGHRELCLENRRGGGWRFTRGLDQEIPRQEERENLGWSRVDHIEILKSGSDQTFGGLCPEGFVYNLEVEGTHTYVANGFVVHNCHHVSAPLFVNSASLFYGRRFSLTATATRTDGLENIYQFHLGRVIHSNLQQDLIPETVFHQLHWDMPVSHKKLVEDRNGEVCMPKIRTYIGKLEWRNYLIYETLMNDLREGRQILVLSHSVEHVESLYAYFISIGGGLIIGDTRQSSRMGILRCGNPIFGTFQLAREGLNKPSLDTLYIVTPFSNPNDQQQAWGRIQRICPGKKEPLVRVFEDTAFTCCIRSCSGLRNILKRIDYPFRKETWRK